MPMPQYNGPMYSQGPTAVGPYNLQGYQSTFGYNPQQTYLPQTQQPQMATQQPQTPSLVGRIVTANDQIPPAEIPSNGTLVNGVNTNVMQTGFGITSAIQQAQFAQQQSAAAAQAQMADCCCSIQRAIDGVNYNNAQNFCNLGNTMQSVGRDIIENQNANYRQLHDELVAYRMEDKDNTIAELRSQVNALNLSASQSNQNTYLIDRLQPCPTPAYVVPNPNGYYGCQQNGYQSCGC